MINDNVYYFLRFIEQICTYNAKNRTWHIMGDQSMFAEWMKVGDSYLIQTTIVIKSGSDQKR